MTESALPEALRLSMAVVGYEIEYQRSLVEVELESTTERVVRSRATIELSVKGATVEHYHNRPIKTAIVRFTEGPFEPDRAGRLHDFGTGISILATLPWADFPGVWAALRLDRVATLVCTIERGTDKVSKFNVKSQGSLGALFGV